MNKKEINIRTEKTATLKFNRKGRIWELTLYEKLYRKETKTNYFYKE